MRAYRVRIRVIAAILVAVVTTSPVTAGKEHGDLFLKNTRQLTYEGNRSGEGYFSPDGKHFILQSERIADNPFYQIFILSFETGDIHRVSPGYGKTTCSFFRPGTDEVLFASTHLDTDAVKKQKEEIEFRASGKKRRYSWDYDETFDIFSAARDGSGIKRLTDARGYDAEGAYSPDGSKIVFCSMRDAYAGELSAEDQERLKIDTAYFGEIYIMDADGSNHKRLTDWPGYDGGSFFTPDGERIVWRHFREDGVIADVYTMKLDGGDRHRVTNFGSMCWAPFFHPSGEYAIFTTNKQGFSNFELYIVDAEGTKEPVRVTYTDGFDGLPAFSPDGNKLIWTSTRTANKQSQFFYAGWDHEAALDAIHDAPVREVGDDESRTQATREAVAGDEKGDFAPEVRAADLRAMVDYLASGKRAGEYIAEYFNAIGLKPLGDDGTYFQKFPFTTGVEDEKGTGRNVLAYLPPASGADDALVLVMGARYDHIGNGADNNASGTAAIMEIAAALTARRAAEPETFGYGVVIAAWSGQETGTIGSHYFAENPTLEWDRVAAYMNFDMVGHVRENTLMIHGIGSSGVWRGLVERRNVPAGFNLNLSDSPHLPTDVTAFYTRKVPAISFFTGSDDTDTLDYDGLERIGKLGFAIAMDVVKSGDRPGWIEVERSAGKKDPRGPTSPYLGTIPDYAGGDDIEGVKLTGVTGGGPADEAGLTGGDIIVEFGGKEIKNIYDYMHALDAVKIGEAVLVVVLRGGKRVEITVVPEARK